MRNTIVTIVIVAALIFAIGPSNVWSFVTGAALKIGLGVSEISQVAQSVDQAEPAVTVIPNKNQQKRSVQVTATLAKEKAAEAAAGVVKSNNDQQPVPTPAPNYVTATSETIVLPNNEKPVEEKAVVQAEAVPVPPAPANTQEPVIVKETVVVEKVVEQPVETAVPQEVEKAGVVERDQAVVREQAPKVLEQPAVEKPETKPDALTVTNNKSNLNLHYYAYDSYNEVDPTRFEDYPLVAATWCQAVLKGSLVDDNQQELIRYGAKLAVTHALTLFQHGQPSKFNTIVDFTVANCQVDAESAAAKIRALVSGMP